MRRIFNSEQLTLLLPSCFNMKQLLLDLGYKKITSGAYKTVKRAIKELGLNLEHFRKTAINLNSSDDIRRPVAKSIRNQYLEKIEYACEICGLKEWLGIKAVLELHHIDGNSLNNEEENIQALCLNCHSQTPNWRGRAKLPAQNKREYVCKKDFIERIDQKNVNFIPNFCLDCDRLVSKASLRCKICDGRFRSGTKRRFEISKEELEKLISEIPMTRIGELFGVSDNAIKRRAKLLGIDLKPMRGYWAKKYAGRI